MQTAVEASTRGSRTNNRVVRAFFFFARVAVLGALKLVEYIDSPRTEVFDTTRDPNDSLNQLTATSPEVQDQLMAFLEPLNTNAQMATNPAVEIDPQLQEELRMLGYLPDEDAHSH